MFWANRLVIGSLEFEEKCSPVIILADFMLTHGKSLNFNILEVKFQAKNENFPSLTVTVSCRSCAAAVVGRRARVVPLVTSPIPSSVDPSSPAFCCKTEPALLGLEQSSSLPPMPPFGSSPSVTIPSSSDSTVVCLLLYLTLSFLYLSSISRPSRRLSIPARNTGRKNPITKAVTRKKRRKWEVSDTTRTVFRIHAC